MSEEKKIIIDEDWKSQVEAEKEALKQEGEEGGPESSAPAGEMPPASLELLISTLATEAMMAMGQLPHPATNEASVNPDHARYVIDMLEVLQKKTKGNLEPQEDTMLTDLLHQLRMLFISVSNLPSNPPPQST